MGFPGGSVVKNLPSNAGDTRNVGAITGWGRSPGEGNGYPLEYSCLENSMDGGAWWNILHGVTESDTTEQLTNHCTCHFQDYFSLFALFIQTWHSALVFGLPLLVSLSSVSVLCFTFTFMHWRRKWQPNPIQSSVLAWRIPGTEKPGGLPSMGSHESYTAEAT